MSKASEPVFNVPPVTLALVVSNIVIFLVQLYSGDDLTGRFAFVPQDLLAAPQTLWPYLTLVTYQFLHGGWLHLGINMLGLLAFGAGAERMLGGARFLVVYLMCGIGAALVNLPFADSVPGVIGASGAISGLSGFLLMQLQRRHHLRMIIVVVASMWLFGIIGFAGIDQPIAWGAHIGGFLLGVIIAALQIQCGIFKSK